MFGFYRVATASPKLSIANPKENIEEILKLSKEANSKSASIILFPELSIIGYSVGDLIFNSALLKTQEDALDYLLKESKKLNIIIVLGYALKYNNRLYNCALILKNGSILGAIPKSYIPNKQEFYEGRYFNSGKDIKNRVITILNQEIPFGVDLIFSDNKELFFGVEICEDLWVVTPPSNQLAQNGANLILNLSASNEIVTKGDYRATLVSTQSARLVCAYAYASSNLGESGSETIFSGDIMIAEYGTILERDNSISLDSKVIYADIDLQRVSNLRVNDTSFNQTSQCEYRLIDLKNLNEIKDINRYYNPHPFVPKLKDLEKRANEITNIQAYALIRRLKQINSTKSIIGVSGGLDSTLALLSINKAYTIANFDKKDIIAITMPGFGTTSKTLTLAKELCKTLGVTLREINIKDLAKEQLIAIGHNLDTHDITYENTQARVRTSILMNLANKEGGIVIGTGDLSEIALGWSTYNGDHMSMYGLNSGIPKTLIKYLIEYYKQDSQLTKILDDILNLPISPELLPSYDDKITQATEDIIGPYELHDFFLYHFVRENFEPKKILFIAQKAFKDRYTKETIKKWLKVFIKRFFTQQFKRDAMPDGVMVGTISLSPRANWRMPSDASFKSFIEELE